MLDRRLMIAVLILCVSTSASFAADAPALDIQEPTQQDLAFRLPTVADEVFELAAGQSKLTVVCFLGAECPLARLYGPRLNELAEQWKEKGVRFVGVSSNLQDSMDDIRQYVKRYKIGFPMTKDYGNKVADQFDAERTPEVFVVDEQLNVRYRGRIDNQYLPGQSRTTATQHDLRDAIAAVLEGKPVISDKTDAPGCIIGREKAVEEVTTDLTFTKHVAGVLNRNCVECHRSGEIGPFSLTDYDEVIGWSYMMLETIDDGRMPPWHADPAHGEFANARHMPEEDKRILREWVEGGMPYGDPKDLPQRPEFTDGWLMPGEPDMVLEMRNRPFVVPAEGTVEYQYFVVDPELKEDRWVTAAQVIPGNRAVVHHCIVFVRPPDGSRFRGIGWLSAYVPGQRFTTLPPGRARHIPAGSKLVFQMHYTPSGTEQEDLTKVGLMFAEDKDITHEVYTLVGIDQEFEIPPHASDYKVDAAVRSLPEKGELLAIAPHMHVRGKSFCLFGKKEGDREILLDVPRYDFNWQHVYELTKPLPLSSVKSLEFTVKFDNSEKNPANPDPTQTVTWGDQTWEEMAVAFFEVAVPRGEEGKWKSDKKPEDPQVQQKKIDDFVADLLKNFDKNNDGQIEWEETPLAFKRFTFRRIDNNDDHILTKAEIKEAAEKRYRRN